MTVAVAGPTHLDARTEAYVAGVLRAIDANAPLLEAFVVGSGATGGFDPETSDVDVVAVVEAIHDRERLVAEVAVLPSPVRDLELVVYLARSRPGEYELNVNRGEERPAEEWFWFVLDAALAQEHAVPVWGNRPWSDFFEPVGPGEIREAMRASLDWSGRQPPDNRFARSQAARARHYLEHGEWITKKEADR